MAFKDDLFQRISASKVFEEGTAVVEQGVVMFKINGITGISQFKAVGQVELVDRGEDSFVDYLDISVILAKGIDEAKVTEALIPRLYELNMTYRTGMFSLDGGGNLVFESAFPVVRDDVDGAVKLFEAEYIDLVEFLDGVYPYLLRVVARPADCNFKEYVLSLMGETDEE